jgi:hypothetical protein
VSIEFIQAIKQLGYDKLAVEQLVRMKDHGVSPDFVKNMKDRGVQNLTIDELVRLRDNGIN